MRGAQNFLDSRATRALPTLPFTTGRLYESDPAAINSACRSTILDHHGIHSWGPPTTITLDVILSRVDLQCRRLTFERGTTTREYTLRIKPFEGKEDFYATSRMYKQYIPIEINRYITDSEFTNGICICLIYYSYYRSGGGV